MEVGVNVLLVILFVGGNAQLIPNKTLIDEVIFSLGPPPPKPATYMAVVPRNIRPNMDLVIPVSLFQKGSSGTITAVLFKDNDKILSEDRIQATAGCDCTLTLKTPSSVSYGSYHVNVTGSGGLKFHETASLWGRHKAISIFVQTDKAKYKPGDTVKYRIFAINSALDPVDVTMDVGFFDPKGNKIEELNGVSNLDGIEGEMPLSDMPPLGNWKIEVKPKGYENADKSYYFDVAEYVLPRFDVTVTLPSFGRPEDQFLSGSVKARYTFGKPVQGFLILTIKKPWSSRFFDVRAIRTEMLINGEAAFNIPMVILERLTRNMNYQTLQVHANVTESTTGITLEGSSNIQYQKHPYRISFHPNMQENFKPDFNPYSVVAKVTLQDNSPPVGVNEPMKITTTFFTDKPIKEQLPDTVKFLEYDVLSPFIDGDVIMKEVKSFPLSEDGTVSFNLTIPEAAATATIKAEFKDQNVYKEISRFRSPSNVFLKAEVANREPLKVGDTALFELSSTERPAQGTYLIVSKNKIVESGKFRIKAQDKTNVYPVVVTREMSPSARFVAYFVRHDGEIVADGLNFVVEEIYENKVTITFDQTENVEPKTKVKLKVTADRDSTVNVLVVDQSVRLLKGGNDITQERVRNELSQYGDTPYYSRGWGMIMPWPIRADDAFDIFSTANLIVLTDGLVYKFNLWELDRPQDGKFQSFSGGRAMAVNGVQTSGIALAGAPRAASAPQGQIREEFPETWIWESAIADGRGVADISAKVPDTITTWVASAYAMNTRTGLGVAPVPANLTAFLHFFLNLQLPYSVVRGEIAVVQVNVFNYHPEDLEVLVTLRGSPDFMGILVETNGQQTEIQGDLARCILVKSGIPTPVFFSIIPTTVGPLQLNVRIFEEKQRNIFDEVFRPLLVKAEGEGKEMNIPILISHKRRPGFPNQITERSVSFVYPSTTVPDSQKIKVTVFGDIFGPSLENLDKLIKMPYGCGEQNMLNFAPAVFAAVYMNATNRFIQNTEFQDKIKRTLRTGYQRELIYQRGDGSFSAFGEADNEGSLWLTAFVAKSFAQAYKLKMIFIDPEVMNKAVRFITSGNQSPDGNFVNTGKIDHKVMQGGSASSERVLTAYILIALQEVKLAKILTDPKTETLLDAAISAATTYLDENIFLPMSDYEAAIGAYALKLVKSPMYATFLGRLEDSVNKTVKDGSMHWNHTSYAMQIEIASYALLTYTLKNERDTGLQILNWLVKRRNSNGGFSSTQDTVVALQALSEFAELIYSKEVDMSIDISKSKGGIISPVKTILLTSESHDVLQYAELDGDVDSIIVRANGSGIAVVDTTWIYNIEQDPDPPSYELTVRTYDETMESFMLEACTRFSIPNAKSNMAIMNIGVPSGFEAQKDGIEGRPFVKRAELSGGRLNIYFDEIPDREICVDVKVQRSSIVAGVKPASVTVYSYYEPGEKVLVSYLPDKLKQNSQLCNICGAECGCEANPLLLSMDQCVATYVPGAPGSSTFIV